MSLINDHSTVKATFHGHDHVQAYTQLDSTRIPSLNRIIHQFVTCPVGADLADCDKPDRYENCFEGHAYAMVEVDGPDIEVNWYQQGDSSNSVYRVNF